MLNTIENIDIDGVGTIPAKVDSGNEAYNVLHGLDIKINNGEVMFNTVNNKVIKRPLEDTIVIHIGSGVKEERPIVAFNITLHGKLYQDVPFSIADRSENEEAVLIGEPFLKKIQALIDVSKS